jgi:hypothetical protein
VVIGTVLDPDMADEVRVTVVATGLGRSVIRPSVRPGGERTEGFREPLRAPVKLVRNGSTGLADFDAMPPTNTAMPPLGLPTAGNNLGLRASVVSTRPPAAWPTCPPTALVSAFLRRQMIGPCDPRFVFTRQASGDLRHGGRRSGSQFQQFSWGRGRGLSAGLFRKPCGISVKFLVPVGERWKWSSNAPLKTSSAPPASGCIAAKRST